MKSFSKRFFVFLFCMMFIPFSFATAEDTNAEFVVKMAYTAQMPDVIREGEYTGEVQNGIPHGYGIFEATNSEGINWHYIGEWQKGYMVGEGGQYWDNGYCAVGSYLFNQMWAGTTSYTNTVDLSDMTYDELVTLKDKINLAIWNSQEWQEVEVPQGVWEIGKDIPAGHWTLKMRENSRNNWCGITICEALDKTGLKAASRYANSYVYEQLSRPGSSYSAAQQIDIVLEAGMYIIIENSDVLFTPYSGKQGLGFK